LRALGWKPQVAFDDGIARTIAWYRHNPAWWRPLIERPQVHT
jgi:dTDP-glucose 4,6-dehydratase